MEKKKLEAGRVFDKLTLVDEYLTNDESGHLRRYWKCLCMCGNTTEKREDALYKRKHQSCGCDTSSIQAANTKRIKWKGVGELSSTFFTACKRSAKKRNIDFQISMKDAWEQFDKQEGICALSGASIKLGGSLDIRRKNHSASLDRIDSTKGYTKDNIQWVHKTVNLMKNVLDQSEFIRWCEEISRFNHERTQ